MMNLSISRTASLITWFLLATVAPLAIYIIFTNNTILLEWNFLTITSTPLIFPIILDPKGLMFSCTVMLISANVLQFSTMYMSEEKYINRFTVLVLLFILSMNMLIFFPHFMTLLLGWDGLGIISFLLVIYYMNPKSLAAGMITVLTNRIGDVMILLSIMFTLNQGHWNIMHMWNSNFMFFQISCIMVAAMTKSAQMPFSSWLPAAMAAPTPVSALVHSSTLVTAGVFLLIRFYPFLESLNMFKTITLFTAVTTMVMAGISAMTECDMKKIIALSTLSQLGMMMTALGLGNPNMAFFHMTTHAMFKALLFICAGTLINFHNHSQDLRWMGNLTSQMPITSSCMLISNMALCGLPFLAGFYSKDLIVETSMFYSFNTLMIMLIIMSISLTTLYSMRFMIMTIWSQNMSNSFLYFYEPKSTTTPMIILSLMASTAGSTISWTMQISAPMHMSSFMKMLPLLMITTGIIFGFSTYSFSTTKAIMMKINMSHFASCSMWWLVPMSSQLMLKFPMWASHNLLKSMDQAWLEVIGGQGTFKMIMNASKSSYMIQPTNPMTYISTSLMFMFLMYVLI